MFKNKIFNSKTVKMKSYEKIIPEITKFEHS